MLLSHAGSLYSGRPGDQTLFLLYAFSFPFFFFSFLFFFLVIVGLVHGHICLILLFAHGSTYRTRQTRAQTRVT